MAFSYKAELKGDFYEFSLFWEEAGPKGSCVKLGSNPISKEIVDSYIAKPLGFNESLEVSDTKAFFSKETTEENTAATKQMLESYLVLQPRK